jgi:hypothetical protein
LSPGSALALPLLFTALMMAGAWYAPVHQSPRLLWSFLGTGVVLLAWNGILFASALHQRRRFTLEVVLRKQHYVQACAHTSILLYWGWYWRTVYESAFLIVAQLLFAYAFDLLLTWSRRDNATLGFGPFPIVFSTNLFLWFRQDWFYLQFAMIALAFAGKELIRWNRDGRHTHVFNPSAFTLTVFSLALILTGASDITWGQDIAITQFYPPHMYLFLFLVALPGQFFFGVTTMTMAAVLTTYLFGLCYYALTGTYFFFDSYIPIAVFLGMHLLFTDPSTAPRTDLGRIIFGMLYGVCTIVLYALLGMAGLPTFYDKLLQVPLLNLSVKSIDRAVRSEALQRFDPTRIGPSLSGSRRNLAYMSSWAIVFTIMSAAQGVGDRHRGQWIPFWQQACQQGHARACQYLVQLHATYCRAGSRWSCNELDVLLADNKTDRVGAIASRDSPPFEELPILLRGSKGPITDRSVASLYARACDQGWPDSCERIASIR